MRKKQMKKRSLAVVLLAVLILLTLTACGQKKTDAAPTKMIEGVDDLEGAKIGVQIGTVGDTYASDYEGDDAGTKVVRYNKGADAVQALKQYKIDCVIIDEQPALAFVEKNPELKILDEAYADEDYAICVAKDNTELLDKINGALDEIKKDGTLENIINNFIGVNAGKTPYVSPEGTSRENGTLTMATNVAFPPYEYYENGKAIGIDVDMAQAVADRLGMKLVVSDMEFDSIIAAVQSGKADMGVAGLTVTEDRLKNINFSEAYTTARQVIIVNTGKGAVKQGFVEKFKQVFIEKARWQYIPKGLGTTILITLFAGLIGIMLGFLFAIIRVANDRNEERSIGMRILNVLVKIYLTFFRGTPMMVQLLIAYFVVFATVQANPVMTAIFAFGLNSGAYVSEAIRAGIMSVDFGQFEAGRSLGFTYGQTMIHIILPQAFKNSLPAIFNEFIALLKESAIVGYIGLVDLTKAGDIIRSNTYEAFMPLFAVALVYLVIVMFLTSLVGRLERRLKKDAR